MSVAGKATTSILSVVFMLVIGAGVYLYLNFGSIAKNMTERVASETLGVHVSVGSIQVDLKNKAVTVSNVKVGNPPGYRGSHAATIDTIYLKAHTLSQALLNFDDVTVTGSEIYLEVRPEGTNLTDIKKRVNSKAAAGDKAAQQIKVIIENMKIQKLRVNPSVLLITAQQIAPIVIPDISLSGIGTKQNGVLASEAIAQIFNHLVDVISKESNKAGFYQGLSPDALKGVGVGQIDVLKKDIQDNIKGIKGLFGKSH